MAPAEREQPEPAAANRVGESRDPGRSEPVRRQVVEHHGIDADVPRGGLRQRGRGLDRRQHAPGAQDPGDLGSRTRRHHYDARRCADLDAQREHVVLRPAVAGHAHLHAERVPPWRSGRVRECERVVPPLQHPGLNRGPSLVAAHRQRGRCGHRRANGDEERDRVAQPHGARPVEPREGGVAELDVGEWHRIDRDVPGAGGRHGCRRVTQGLLAVAERHDAAALGRGCDCSAEAAFEIRRRGARPEASAGQKLARRGRDQIGRFGEAHDAAGCRAAIGVRADGGEPAGLDRAHARIDARGAIEREHDARRARTRVRIDQGHERRERAEHEQHGGDAGAMPPHRIRLQTPHSAAIATSATPISQATSECRSWGAAALAQSASARGAPPPVPGAASAETSSRRRAPPGPSIETLVRPGTRPVTPTGPAASEIACGQRRLRR